MSSSSRPPVARGALAGVVAFLAGYLVTYVWQVRRVREALDGINVLIEVFGGESLPAWKAVGWLFFNAHYVDTQFPGFGGTQTRNFVASGDFPALLYAVPVVVLLAVSILLAYSQRPDALSTGVRDGATLAIGYAISAAIALFAVTATRGEASITPDPVTALLLAGVVYPLVLGGVGGAIAAVLRDRDDPPVGASTN